MPVELAHLKTYKGYPIPAATFVGNDGIPDFKIIDMEAWLRCVLNKLCPICEKPLDYWVWWIGGELSLRNGVFVDPPMHEVCARFSAKVCPFISGDRKYASHLKDHGEGVHVLNIPMGQPKAMYLVKSRRDSTTKDGQLHRLWSGNIVHYEEIKRMEEGEET